MTGVQTIEVTTTTTPGRTAKKLVEPKVAEKAKEMAGAIFSASPTPAVQRDRERFKALMKTNQTETAMLITPAMAEIMLETNTGNRNVNPHRVQLYGEMMKAGEWSMTGEPIIFSKQGILNDGQHRLRASVLVGVSFKADVRFGVERDTFVDVDTGQKRTVAQVLSIESEKHTACLGASLRLLAFWLAKDPMQNSNLTRQISAAALSNLLEEHPGMRESVERGSSAYNEFRGLTATTLSFCHYIFAQKHRAQADKFIRDIATGENMTKGDPVLALRRFVINTGMTGARATKFYIPVVIKAWNARRANSQIMTMKRQSDDDLRANYPHPI